MAAITIDRVVKRYGDGFPAVNDVSLEIADGEFMILVGPSGCGKSTLLRMIVGLEDITGGEIRIGDARVNEKPPRDRNLAMVFQNYALYPHLTVFENIAFPLRLRKLADAEVRAKVTEAAEVLELGEHLDRKPAQLSGGQRQRVAMGRAIVRAAAAFLFDEPLSNLDAQLRAQMRTEISRLQRKLGITTVYVTHDQVEAMTLGDRVAVLRRGVLQQVDTPRALYERPANLFVAGFIGSPAMNLLPGSVDGGRLALPFATIDLSGELTARFGGAGAGAAGGGSGASGGGAGGEGAGANGERSGDAGVRSAAGGEGAGAAGGGSGDAGVRSAAGGEGAGTAGGGSAGGRSLVAGIRPEHIEVADVVDPKHLEQGVTFEVTVDVVEWLGSEQFAYIPFQASPELVEPLQRLAEELDREAPRTQLVASIDPSSQVSPGDTVRLWFDPAQLHLFDARSGERLPGVDGGRIG